MDEEKKREEIGRRVILGTHPPGESAPMREPYNRAYYSDIFAAFKKNGIQRQRKELYMYIRAFTIIYLLLRDLLLRDLWLKYFIEVRLSLSDREENDKKKKQAEIAYTLFSAIVTLSPS